MRQVALLFERHERTGMYDGLGCDRSGQQPVNACTWARQSQTCSLCLFPSDISCRGNLINRSQEVL
jgi:hypothetical protein